jgi:xylulose-5-phosphate/fructose-6-phosphate phosphoketolase
MMDTRLRARAYTREHGEDLPEVANWSWGDAQVAAGSEDTGGDNA